MTDTETPRQREQVVLDWLLPDFFAPERGSGSQVGKVIVNGKAVPAGVAAEYAEAIGKVADFAANQGTQRDRINTSSVFPIGNGLTLYKAPGAWEGSFVASAYRLAEDVLSDCDAPVDVSVILTDDTGDWFIQGLLTSVKDGHILHFEDGVEIDIDDINGFRLDS